MTHRLRTAVAAALGALAMLPVPVGAAQAAAADRLSPPQRPFLIEASPTSLTIGWEPAGGPVAGYTVRTQTGGHLFEPILRTTANHATLTGLRPYTVYNVDLVAHAVPESGLSDSVASQYGVFRTTYVPEAEPPTAPGKPEVLEVKTNSARLRHAAATDNLHVERYVTQILRDGTWSDLDKVHSPSDGGVPVLGAPFQTRYLNRLTGETTYTLAIVAVDLSGNRSPRSEPVTFTTGPFTPAPSCSVHISGQRRHSYYRLVVDQSNTTPSAVDALPVTFTLPVEHTATADSAAAQAAGLSRDGADASLSWPVGDRVEPGYFARQLAFTVTYNGNLDLPADFRLAGAPCTVQLSPSL